MDTVQTTFAEISKKNTARGRFSGGISFYFRSDLKKYISVVESNQCNIIWIKISKELFPFDDDVFICHTYIPPNISRVFSSTNFDFFEQIEIDIVKMTWVKFLFLVTLTVVRQIH